MTAVDDILREIPISSLAERLGVDEATADSAVRQALPALLGGMEANARDPQGAASLARALGQHDSRLVDGGVDLDQVDTDEGQQIVSHVFGANRDQVISTLGGLPATGSPAGGGGLIAKLLPMLAPIVMSYLAKKMGGAGSSTTSAGSTKDASDEGGLGGLGDILGGMLGGGGSGSSSAGGGIGDILGGLLGGGRR